jgi:hypothetical protein
MTTKIMYFFLNKAILLFFNTKVKIIFFHAVWNKIVKLKAQYLCNVNNISMQ